jgi:hypothetical protein
MSAARHANRVAQPKVGIAEAAMNLRFYYERWLKYGLRRSCDGNSIECFRVLSSLHFLI